MINTTDPMFFQIAASLIVLLLGAIGWIIKSFVSNMRDDSKTFRSQLEANSKEHSELLSGLTMLNQHIPNIKECEDDLENVKLKVNDHENQLEKHDKDIDRLYKRAA